MTGLFFGSPEIVYFYFYFLFFGAGLELGPGFAVLFEAGAAGSVGVEAEHGRGHAGFYGEDVPDVAGDDVGDEEVDVVGSVDGAAFADGVGGADFVGSGAEDFGAFDLHSPEEFLWAAVVGGDDEVVALAVSPGLGDVVA